MKPIIFSLILAGGLLLLAACPPPSVGMSKEIPATVVDTFDQAGALAQLAEQIKGKEDLPSGEVFKNMKIMGQIPAGRMLKIMEFGFSNSLGVTCTHCHNPENWAGEELKAKQIARDMWVMTGKINNELLPGIDNLASEKPMVNCTTCHRGHVIPATKME